MACSAHEGIYGSLLTKALAMLSGTAGSCNASLHLDLQEVGVIEHSDLDVFLDANMYQ